MLDTIEYWLSQQKKEKKWKKTHKNYDDLWLHTGAKLQRTKSLFIFDFKIATPNANHYLSIKPSSATHSFSNCAWAELIWTRVYWQQHESRRLKLSKSPTAYLASQYHSFFSYWMFTDSSSYATHTNIIRKGNRIFNTINLFLSILHKLSKSL